MSAQPSILHGAAEGMIKRALVDSAVQLGVKGSARVIAALQAGDCTQCEVVRYNLARQISDLLSTVDPKMRAIYLYNPEYASEDYDSTFGLPASTPAIHLIAWTRARSSLPSDVLQALRAAIHSARADLLCPQASGQCFDLSVNVVNDADVRARKGYAAMIDSLIVRPTTLWRHTSQRGRRKRSRHRQR